MPQHIKTGICFYSSSPFCVSQLPNPVCDPLGIGFGGRAPVIDKYLCSMCLSIVAVEMDGHIQIHSMCITVRHDRGKIAVHSSGAFIRTVIDRMASRLQFTDHQVFHLSVL